MAQKLQHIVFADELETNVYNAKRTKALCGKKTRSAPSAGDHIPTCTPCARLVLAMYNARGTR